MRTPAIPISRPVFDYNFDAARIAEPRLPDITITPPPPYAMRALHNVGGLYIVAIWLKDRVAHAGAETKADAIAIVGKFANSPDCEKVGAWLRGEEYDKARAIVHWARTDERKGMA